ncbi:hypothetical protein KSS87_003074 [Heliosperma pusillum]|nr:hypothetical protein KSS87_003074 [Heliosperma pusillum]
MSRGVRGFVLGDIDSDAQRRSSPIVTRSMTSRVTALAKPSNTLRRNAKTRRTKVKEDKAYRPSKMPKKIETSSDKLYEIPGSGGTCYSYLPPEEYLACKKEYEDMLSNHHLTKDPSFFQQQNEVACRQFFGMIQGIRKEMADYELVEPMAVTTILARGCWAHMNFKAKHKDSSDSSTAIYFAELDVVNKNVTSLIELDIDFSTDTCAYKRCRFCHQEEGLELAVTGVGCVYHPVDAKLFLR